MFGLGYFGSVLYLVFFAQRRFELHHRIIHWLPLKSSIDFYRNIDVTRPSDIWSFGSNLIGNIALFAPFPIFLSFFFKGNSRQLLLITFCCSCLIELLQFIFIIGVADIDDVLLNTTGAVLGLYFSRKITSNLQ